MSQPRIIRGAAGLTVGTLFVQAGGAVGQFIYAIWLTPQDFGVWATASASIFVLGALVNAGEVNGYLVEPASGLRDVLSRTRRINLVLCVLALSIAAIYALIGSIDVAAVTVILAVALPLQGRTDLLVAAFIKGRLNVQLVVAQIIATVIRLSVGIGAAWLWRSPIALGLAVLGYTMTMVLINGYQVKRHPSAVIMRGTAGTPPLHLRRDRATHKVTQVLPAQIDYFLVSLIASQELLGIYYLAYQATSAITGVITGPLTRTTIAELSHIDGEQRTRVAGALLLQVTALSTIGVLVVTALASKLQPLIPESWAGVIVPFAILLAGVPARFLTPLGEALDIVNGRWRRSSALNLVDAAGTSLASLTALSGDVVLLSLAISVWKVLFGAGRGMMALEGGRRPAALGVVSPVLVNFALIGWSLWASGHVITCVQLIVAATCTTQALLRHRIWRSGGPGLLTQRDHL